MSLLYKPDKVDTHLRAYGDAYCVDETKYEVLDGTGYSETLKFSNCREVVVANKCFAGAPREDDIDIVRGSSFEIGPNHHDDSRAGGQNITIKGGVCDVCLRGRFGTAVFGMYSNYDRWFALPRTCGISFADDAEGRAVLWWAERPWRVPRGVRLVVRPRIVVVAYFLLRSIQQQCADAWRTCASFFQK